MIDVVFMALGTGGNIVSKEDVISAVIENCKRLIKDAHLLLDHGSSGAAMSLAILAFEEAGKGHQIELDLTKGKATPSWHHYRQFVAAFALTVSVLQKYGFPSPVFPPEIREKIEELWKETKTLKEKAAIQVPAELEIEAGKYITKDMKELAPDEETLFLAEIRWARKVLKTAATGDLESQRQRGIYVDFDDDSVESNPKEVKFSEAARWIGIAERVLLLLEHGDINSPFGAIAKHLDGLPRPFPEKDKLAERYSAWSHDTAEIFLEMVWIKGGI